MLRLFRMVVACRGVAPRGLESAHDGQSVEDAGVLSHGYLLIVRHKVQG